MATRAVEAGLVLVFVTMLWAGATAQSSQCSDVLTSLAPCLEYVTGNSSTPALTCCSMLPSVIQSSPECLCDVMNNGGSLLGPQFNQKKAMALPAACNVQTSLSHCNAASPTGTPDNTTPSGDGPSSDGSSIRTSLSLLVSLVSAVSYISIFKTY